jgi:hypothetical protein
MKATQTKVPDNAELQYDKEETFKYQWGMITALVSAYVNQNHIGAFAAWAMILDAVSGDYYTLEDEVLHNHLSLYDAMKKLDLGGDLLMIATRLFIKQEGMTDGKQRARI